MIARNGWITIQIIGFIISCWGVLAMKIGNFNIQPEVKTNALFRTNGPYKLIRNPMYVGLILFFGASLISNYSNIRLIVLVILILVFIEKIKLEEKFLLEKFGEIYADYKKKTYKLIPFLY
jgi:protein-S-isoprenylcysteine O-methyltransferase Ste14